MSAPPDDPVPGDAVLAALVHRAQADPRVVGLVLTG